MRTGLREQLSYANVMATIAVFIALGGSAYAAVKLSRNSVSSQHIRNGQVKRADIARNAINSAKVADGSLLAGDFMAGQLPSGPAGQTGAAGPKGDIGPEGPKGDIGATGPRGPSNGYYASAGSPAETLTLGGPGSYVLFGRVAVQNTGMSEVTVSCAFQYTGGSSTSHAAPGILAVPAGKQATVPVFGMLVAEDGHNPVVNADCTPSGVNPSPLIAAVKVAEVE